MSLIEIKLNMPRFWEALKSRETELLLTVAATLQTNRGLMFDDSNAGRETPWAPLKYRDGQPLSLTGTLRKSWQGNMQGGARPDGIVRLGFDKVTVGTEVAYAAIHNTGGTIVPTRKKVLWIPLPQGKANSSTAPTKHTKGLIKEAKKKKKEGTRSGPPVVFYKGKWFLLAKKVTIPKRPMDEWSDQDQQELEETMRKKLKEILKSA